METTPSNPTSEAHRLRILIVRTGAMGDILHALPAVAALRRARPDTFIGWAIEPHWAPLLASESATPQSAAMPLIDRVHPVPTRAWKTQPFSWTTLRQIARLRRDLHGERYDVAADLQGSIRSAVIGRISGSARLVGPRRPRERQARALYGERIALRQTHVIGQGCELLAAAAALSWLDPVKPPLPFDQGAEEWCDRALAAAGSSNPFVLLAPGAGWGAKRWPIAKFADLTRSLLQQGSRVLVHASPETAVSPDLLAAGAQAVPCSLAQLIALTRRAALVVGGDTGPIHLAGALGRPVVALFGPTDPARNGPLFPDSRTIVLRHPSSVLDHRRHGETEAGLARISLAEVLDAVHELLPCTAPAETRKEEAHG